MSFKNVLHLPRLQYFIIVPSLPIFLLFGARSSGTGLIVSCAMGVLFGLSNISSDLLQSLDSRILFVVN